MADFVVVIAPDGYVGKHTLAEIRFAMIARKPILYYPPKDATKVTGNFFASRGNPEIVFGDDGFVSILGGRQSGKSSLLIMLSNETKIPIVVPDYASAKVLRNLAKDIMEDIPAIYIYNDNSDHLYSHTDQYDEYMKTLLPSSSIYTDDLLLAQSWKLMDEGFKIVGKTVGEFGY
jgi:hypothetical protein